MIDIEFNKETSTQAWDRLTYKEKNRLLYERQVALLDLFLEKNAISKAQHDKSLHDLTVKMKNALPDEAEPKTE